MSSPITLEALSILLTIDKRGSYAAAAEELNKVPSALSYVVQKLEEQLETTLFQKQGRRSVLTPAGKHLVTQGEKILDEIDKLADKTKSIATGWEPRIRIAIDSMFNHSGTFQIIQKFLSDYPDIELDIREEVMSGGWEALIDDDVDLLIGAAGPVPQQKGIHGTAIAKLDRVFAVHPDHPLAKEKPPISHDRLAKERTVVVHDSARTAIPWTKGIITQSRYFYVPTVDCKVRAQLAGIGCGYLPRQHVQDYLDRGQLVELEIENPPHTSKMDMFMAWKIVNQGKGLKALKNLFIEHQNDLLESC